MCSRTEEYRKLTKGLQLVEAVPQPLTRKKICDYSEMARTPLDEIRAALEVDGDLLKLMESPLTLGIVKEVYQGKADALRAPDTPGQKREERLLAAYVEQIFERRPIKGPYTEEQARHWLSWLAQSMRERGQSEFDLDRCLQPDWLPEPPNAHAARPNPSQRWLVALIPAIVSGVVGGVVIGLSVGLLARPLPGVLTGQGPGAALVDALGVGRGVGLGVGPFSALAVGLVSGLVFALIAVGGKRADRPGDQLRWPWLGLGLGVGLSFVPLTGPVVGLVAGLVTMGGERAYELVHDDGMEGTWPGRGCSVGRAACSSAVLQAGRRAGRRAGLRADLCGPRTSLRAGRRRSSNH